MARELLKSDLRRLSFFRQAKEMRTLLLLALTHKAHFKVIDLLLQFATGRCENFSMKRIFLTKTCEFEKIILL